MGELGRGRRSIVKLVNKDNVKMARKEIDVSNLCQEEIELINEEIRLLSVLRDRSVLIYKQSFYDDVKKKLYIYTEYFENGDLLHLIQKKIAAREYFDDRV